MKKPLLALALALFAQAADAAIVYMKDGGRLEGTIVSATARDVQLHTATGTVTLPVERIDHIDYAGQAAPVGAPQASAPVAYTPPPLPPNEFAIEIGFAGPLSDVNFHEIGGGSASNGDAGVALGLRYLRRLEHKKLSLGAGFEWLYRSGTDSFNLFPNGESSVSGSSVLLMGLMKWVLHDKGSAQPYLLAGVGAHHTTETIDVMPNPGFVWADTGTFETRRVVDGSAWGAAGTARLGVDLLMLEPSVFSFEAGWTGLSGATYGATIPGLAQGVSGVSGPIHILTVSGHWGWRF